MESHENYRSYHSDNSSFFEPKYFLMFMILLFVPYFLWKNSNTKQEPIKDKVWKKFAFSYQDMMNTFDQTDRELLKNTFHNTIFNTKPSLVTKDVRKLNKKKLSVQFDLNKNVTHLFQYNGC
ncbi:unnamed protein product (macronuclear) [Paramecium tetraurelia]|uniref:Uncharacterized protein n=1 Tax=Paramecium tetraurelia TaxID=5888 RepID=A0D778_PARTE|nr:uncharacterized protein GSPATT00001937001 [Paramecium tetraurelia]CAK78895.1 unnamed protein product [Paramecium tetraurelia]|eukprot:XP_001446292.1 hypothetical protein (macronuclear) [Paramecium tetraurelia strain d4-2]